jgi:CheY-like chemotaxis protein
MGDAVSWCAAAIKTPKRLALYYFERPLPKILVVDDEELVLNVIRGALNSAGHEITVAKSGKEALEAAQSADAIELLVVDHSLRPERGPDIANRILLQHPAMRVLHISAYFSDHFGDLPPNAGFMQKPFTSRQIKDAVAAMLDNDKAICQG